MYAIQYKIIDKVNENQEEDVELYAWDTIPNSLRHFWANWFQKEKLNENLVDLPITNLNQNEK